jgi:hypothetical protein
MFDSQYKLNVMRLPKYSNKLDMVNGYPLVKVNQRSQLDAFGCELTGWADYFNITEEKQCGCKNETYLFLYHCKMPGEFTWVIRAATIIAYNKDEEDQEGEAETYNGFNDLNEPEYEIKPFDGSA